MIEDTELAAYVVTRSRGGKEIGPEEMVGAVRLIDSKADEAPQNGPEEAIVRAAIIRDFAKAPMPHQEVIYAIFSKFINYKLIELLRGAAGRAAGEGTTTTRLRHFLPHCEDWPYPLILLEC